MDRERRRTPMKPLKTLPAAILASLASTICGATAPPRGNTREIQRRRILRIVHEHGGRHTAHDRGDGRSHGSAPEFREHLPRPSPRARQPFVPRTHEAKRGTVIDALSP